MELNDLLQTAIECRASRVLLLTGSPPAYRICGNYQQADLELLSASACDAICNQLLNPGEQEELEAHRAVETVVSIPILGRFRINAQQQQSSVSILIQPLPANALSLDSIGVAPGFRNLIEARSGLVVIGGPSDSGRSTTVASLIAEINQWESRFIVTVESGIETKHESGRSMIVQREIGEDCSSMYEGLKQASQQDPDIVAATELTTGTEVETILDFANSGRLAIIEASGPSSAYCLQQMIALVAPDRRRRCREQLSECLLGVAIQNLIPSASGQGRVLAQELLLANAAIRDRITQARMGDLNPIFEDSRYPEMQSMQQAVEKLMAAGQIAPQRGFGESTEWLAHLPELLPSDSQ